MQVLPHCQSCFDKTNPAKMLADLFLKVPEDFIAATLSKDPLAILQLDELGPLFIGNKNSYVKVWILIAVEIVTRHVHLLPMQYQDTVSFIASLKILQSRWGRLTKIIVDAHLSHTNLDTTEHSEDTVSLNCVSPTLVNILNSGEKISYINTAYLS